MAVAVTTTPKLQVGDPEKLFESPNVLVDLMPDGRLLMRPDSATPAVPELALIVNWFDELRRKVGGPVR